MPRGLGALDGEHRVGVDPIADLRLELDRVRLEPLEIALVVGRVGDGQVALLGQPVGEEVIEDPAVLPAETGVLALRRPGSWRRRWRAAAGAAPPPAVPRSRSRPCGRRRRRRKRLATRRCSARMPSYSTGISQPANGTSLAPASTWASYSGVLFSVLASTRATILAGMGLPEDELTATGCGKAMTRSTAGDYDAARRVGPSRRRSTSAPVRSPRCGEPEALRAWMEPDAFESQVSELWQIEVQGNRALIQQPPGHAAPAAASRWRSAPGPSGSSTTKGR